MVRPFALLAALAGLAVVAAAVGWAVTDDAGTTTVVGASPSGADPAPTAPSVAAPASVPAGDPARDCTIAFRLTLGVEHADVACLERRLVAAAALDGVAPDRIFDQRTDLAVRAFQRAHGLVVDGVVGPRTAHALGAGSGSQIAPPDPATCPARGRAAVVDREAQLAWLCDGREVVDALAITSAWSQPDVGTYAVYAKDRQASSQFSGEYSTMTHFVAFTHGENAGARIAFHSVPRDADGRFVQPLDSVGAPDRRGESAGCIRVLPDDAELIWGWLAIGDTVSVIS